MKFSARQTCLSFLAFATAVSLLTGGAGCAEDKPHEPCAPILFHAVWVSVHDADTGQRVETARGFIRDGAFIDSLHVSEGIGRAGEERAGVYKVAVFKDGFVSWSADSVVVLRDECHVQTVRLDVYLERK
jgi:hypothetical protein